MEPEDSLNVGLSLLPSVLPPVLSLSGNGMEL